MTQTGCRFPIEDFFCDAPTPSRRAAFCQFHEAVAEIQRKATGTRGNFAGKVLTGGSDSEPPVKHPRNLPAVVAAPSSDAPTLAELGMLDRKQAARAATMAGTSLQVCNDVDATEATAAPVTILDLNASTCRWPIGDPRSESFRYCGAHAPATGPYCTAHSRRARGP